MSDDDDGQKPLDWVLFTPDFDYVKEPYWVRAPDVTKPVLCYPNAGMMHEMGGQHRYFHPCECEVKFADWEHDEHHPMHRRTKP